MSRVEIPNPQKVLFPTDGLSKADLADYFRRVAPHMLRHIRGRPIAMQRFPDGIQKRGFFQKDVPEHFPGWIARVRVRKRGGALTQAITCDTGTLVYLAGQACVTLHVWLSRAPDIDRPDRVVFDFDPSTADFAAVRSAALRCGALLEDLGLAAFVMSTGSRGLHVWAPLRGPADFEQTRRFARGAAEVMVEREPDALTLEQRKAKRGDRVLIDVMRNGYAQTAVAPYAVRARPGAPVATPLRWRELRDAGLRSDTYTIANLFARLQATGDPWAGMGRHGRHLAPAQRRLDRMRRHRSPRNAASRSTAIGPADIG